MKVRFNTDKVRKHIAALKTSGHSFAYDCGVNRHAWDSIMNEQSNPRLETAYKIASRMGVNIEELLIIENETDTNTQANKKSGKAIQYFYKRARQGATVHSVR